MSLREDEDEENDMTGDAVDQQISFIQRDPFVKKLFEDAIKVLRLVGADENASGKRLFLSRAQIPYRAVHPPPPPLPIRRSD